VTQADLLTSGNSAWVPRIRLRLTVG